MFWEHVCFHPLLSFPSFLELSSKSHCFLLRLLLNVPTFTAIMEEGLFLKFLHAPSVSLFTKVCLGQRKSLWFLVSARVASIMRPSRGHFEFSVFCYEMMSNCSQNCWINWNSAVVCFKRLFHVGVWMFAWFVRPLLATILCVWEIWSGSNNRMYHAFHWLAKKENAFWSQNILIVTNVVQHYHITITKLLSKCYPDKVYG